MSCVGSPNFSFCFILRGFGLHRKTPDYLFCELKGTLIKLEDWLRTEFIMSQPIYQVICRFMLFYGLLTFF